jgi:hypothetical protein
MMWRTCAICRAAVASSLDVNAVFCVLLAGTYGDQPAALKLLLLDEETAHAILNEVRLCLKLSHKNLVQLLDCAVVASNKHAAAAGFPVGALLPRQTDTCVLLSGTTSPGRPDAE